MRLNVVRVGGGRNANADIIAKEVQLRRNAGIKREYDDYDEAVTVSSTWRLAPTVSFTSTNYIPSSHLIALLRLLERT